MVLVQLYNVETFRNIYVKIHVYENYIALLQLYKFLLQLNNFIYIYIYITKTFETLTIFHVSTIFK